MDVSTLKEMMTDGSFHHATYRNTGTVWEGLYVYTRATNEEGGFRGFKLAGAFNNYYRARNPECEEAMALVSGIHVGAYGQG